MTPLTKLENCLFSQSELKNSLQPSNPNTSPRSNTNTQSNPMKSKTILAALATIIVSLPALHAGNNWWQQTGSSGTWDSTSTNWITWGPGDTNLFNPGDSAFFEYSWSAHTVNIATSVTVGGVFFSGAAGGGDGFIISGGTLAYAAGTWNYIGMNGRTETISSYIDATALTQSLDITGVGGTLNLGGGGAFTAIGQGAAGQTLSLTAGTYTVSGGMALNDAGTLKFTIGSGAMLNVGGQLKLTHWDGNNNVTNNNILDFATTGTLSGDYVIASYGSLYGSFGSVTHVPANYAIDFNYHNAHQIALVALSSTWDNGAANGTWDTATSMNWTGSTWGGGGSAIFGATGAGPVTIATGGVTANSLIFNSAGYSIGGAALTLTGVADITTHADAQVSAALTGSAGLTKSGTSTLTLAGTNTYTGNTTVNGGVLDVTGQIYNAGAGSAVLTVNSGATLRCANFAEWANLGPLGSSASSLVVNGGTLDMNATSGWVGNFRDFTIGALGATLSASQPGSEWLIVSNVGSFTNNSNLTLNSANFGEIDSPIVGTGSLTKTGSGQWQLTAANTYSGPTIINGGTLRLNTLSATCGSNSAVTLANTAGAELRSSWWTGSAQVGISFSIGSLSGGGALGGNVIVHQTATMTVGTDNTSTTYAGIIADGFGPANVTKVGTGTLTLTNANIYGGTTTISGGTLQLGDGTSGHNGSLASASIVNDANLVFNLSGSSSFNGAISGSGTTTVQAGTLNLSGSIAPAATLAIAGGAVLHLPNSGTATVAALVINGSSQPNGLYGASNTGGAITGAGVIQVGSSGTPQYLAWATSITGFTDTYPTHDPDGDGMTNQQEFAFNLDPTSGASNNPIVVPFDKTTGTFSYTRLDPAVSGLTYKVYTSMNLSTWTLDSGAGQVATPGVYTGDEIVKVTLSPGLLTAPKLFVRVAAE
jgi:autotransporter-associated beta strand protein